MKKFFAVFGVSVLILSAAVLVALKSGSVNLGMSEIFGAMTGKGGENAAVVNQIRLPRIFFALLVGGMLAVSGAVLQAALKNPLVDPFITGISSGAAFGAAAAIIAGISNLIAPAIAGAVVTVILVYRLSVTYAGLDVTKLLLTGVMIGSFFSAMIMLLNALFSRDIARVVLWLMGDLSNISPSYIMPSAVIATAVIILCMFFANDLNILSAGEEEAKTLGVNTELIKAVFFISASTLTAISVALSGVIGFVGLIVPHIVRKFTGPDLRLVIPVSFITGAAFLLFADTAARTLFLPSEMPVGVITGLIGVPVFIAILNSKAKKA